MKVKDREALIRGYLDDIKEGNISIEDALDSIMCVAEQKTAERIFKDLEHTPRNKKKSRRRLGKYRAKK